MNYVRFARLLALVAGLLDFGAGLGLVFLPGAVLPRMGISVPVGDALVYLRFVGAFVAAVGTSYLSALLLGGIPRLRGVLEFTMPFRMATGLFSVVAIARGWLTTAWAGVPASDFALIGIQLWLITKLPPYDALTSSSPSL